MSQKVNLPQAAAVLPVGAAAGGAPPVPVAPKKWPFWVLLALQLAGALGVIHYWANFNKVVAVLLAVSALAQMILDFLPSATPSKPLMSALARLVPVIAAVAVVFTA